MPGRAQDRVGVRGSRGPGSLCPGQPRGGGGRADAPQAPGAAFLRLGRNCCDNAKMRDDLSGEETEALPGRAEEGDRPDVWGQSRCVGTAPMCGDSPDVGAVPRLPPGFPPPRFAIIYLAGEQMQRERKNPVTRSAKLHGTGTILRKRKKKKR